MSTLQPHSRTAQGSGPTTLQPDTPNWRDAEIVEIASLTIADELFPRVALNDEKVAEYAALMQEGVHFPPIAVTRIDGEPFPNDGRHRIAATLKCGWTEIPAHVRDGDWTAAVEAACSANATRGLPLGADDRRKAIKMLLGLSKWHDRSDRDIARQCGVTHPTVAAVRAEIEAARAELSGKRFPDADKPLKTNDRRVVVHRGGQEYPMTMPRRAAEPELEPVPLTPEESSPSPPRPRAAPEPPQPGGAMMRMRNGLASLEAGDVATLIAESIMARVDVAVAIGSRANVMTRLGGGVAARSSISAWLKSDVRDSQRIDVVKEAVATIKHRGERQKLIEELARGDLSDGVPAFDAERIVRSGRDEMLDTASLIWSKLDPADRRSLKAQWGWQRD